jgi:hypothetical protein
MDVPKHKETLPFFNRRLALRNGFASTIPSPGKRKTAKGERSQQSAGALCFAREGALGVWHRRRPRGSCTQRSSALDCAAHICKQKSHGEGACGVVARQRPLGVRYPDAMGITQPSFPLPTSALQWSIKRMQNENQRILSLMSDGGHRSFEAIQTLLESENLRVALSHLVDAGSLDCSAAQDKTAYVITLRGLIERYQSNGQTPLYLT